MTVTLYGIKNCSTMKKAWTWLDESHIDYTFHDYKKSGIDSETLTQWCGEAGWQTLLNKAGTTFRKLPDEKKQDLSQEKAIALMVEQPSMIKRPVIIKDGDILVGFKPESYRAFFSESAA